MTPPTGRPTPGPEAGIERLERFLASESERTRARTAAEAFADQMPLLSRAERQQLLRLYTSERLAESRRLRTQRDREQASQEARERLRRRCISVALALGAFSTVLTLFLIATTLR
ncbi:hypothetical protein [Streptomyces sp. NPDC057460]|uniref:hypothetical protein n=1 Tax=Streptomyces sp. NPDC057460 TaxID=3346141 RepID=UPI00367791D8